MSTCVLIKTHLGKSLVFELSCSPQTDAIVFFSCTKDLFNHAVKLHNYWFIVQCIKNEPMGRHDSAVDLEPVRMGGAIRLYKRPFRHRILRLLRLKRRLSLADT